jgi:hypothetical protein
LLAAKLTCRPIPRETAVWLAGLGAKLRDRFAAVGLVEVDAAISVANSAYTVQVVALWMGHDAKVSLKHYAQTTDEHFERATRAAESDAPALQKAVQQAAVGNGSDSQTEDVNGDGVATCATPCDSPRHTAHAFSGEGGKQEATTRNFWLVGGLWGQLDFYVQLTSRQQ